MRSNQKTESWVRTTRQRDLTLGPQGYGSLWWKQLFPHGTGQVEVVFTAGNGGNFIFTVPSLELVVALTGSNYNTSRSDTPLVILPLVLNAIP